MHKTFKTQVAIKFRDADPAQIMYFANIFSLAHDAFEEFIVAAGYSWDEWFRTTEYMIPIRHTEADFKAPFLPGHIYDIEITVNHFGESSFKMKYIFSKNEKIHATVQMVHAILDQKTKQKIVIPEIMKKRLQAYLKKD